MTAQLSIVPNEDNDNSVPISKLTGKKNIGIVLNTTSFDDIKDNRGYIVLYKHKFTHSRMLLTLLTHHQNSYIKELKSRNGYCKVTGIMPDLKKVDILVPGDLKVTVLDDKEAGFLLDLEEKYKYHCEGIRELLFHHMTIGADPEIFVVNGSGALIPAPEFLGSKSKPSLTAPSSSNTNYGSKPCYWDGFQAEFTTWAGTCLGFLTDSIYYGLKGVLDHARKKFPDAKLCLNPVMTISRELLDSAVDEVVEFGCTPSKNAYDLKVDLPSGRNVPFRSAGGHMHFGIGNTSYEQALPMVKSLDAILGVASVALFAGIDNPMRRQYYGLPGEFRLPPHGLEYRPLSAVWLSHPFITNLVFDIGRKAMLVGKGGHLSKIWKGSEEETIKCMIDSDVEKAKEILLRNEEMFRYIIYAAYPGIIFNSPGSKTIFNVFYNGMSSILKDPYDIETNWGLTNGKYVLHGGAGEINVSRCYDKLTHGKKL